MPDPARYLAPYLFDPDEADAFGPAAEGITDVELALGGPVDWA